MDVKKPRAQKIMLRPTEPVPLRMVEATGRVQYTRRRDWGDEGERKSYLRVEKTPVPIILLILRKMMVMGPTV